MRFAFWLVVGLLFSMSSHASPFAAEAAVYRVNVTHAGGETGGQGTGVLIAPDKILTNCHVVEKAQGWIRLEHRRTGQEFRSNRFKRLGNFDACVILGQFEGSPVPVVPGTTPGESIWVFGFPSSNFVAIQGTVKGLMDSGTKQSLVLAAFCSPGSSGGPVVNIRGELVGLQWGMTLHRNNQECLAIPSAFLIPYF